MKYLVMECNENYAVLLDEQAGFVRAVNTGYAVGDTVEDPKLIMVDTARSPIIMKITKVIVAAAACMAVVFGVNYYNEYMTEYSYITISINPDIKMSLNRHGEVLSLAGLNDEGDILIDGYDPDRKDKTTVADELLERAMDMGYLSDGDTITFEIDTPNAALSEEYGAELQNNALEHTKKMSEVEVIIRKPEDASAAATVQPSQATTTTAAQTQITQTETTFASVSEAASSASSTTTVTTATTATTRRHNPHYRFDDDLIIRPPFRYDGDDDHDNREYADIIDDDNDNDNDIDGDTGNDINDDDNIDIDRDDKSNGNVRDEHGYGYFDDFDADSRDRYDYNDYSENSSDKDDSTSDETDSTEEITDFLYDFKDKYNDESDIEEDTETSINDDDISDDEEPTDITET